MTITIRDAPADANVEVEVYRKPVRLDLWPSYVSGFYAWVGTSFVQSAITHDGDDQYAVWVRQDRQPLVGKRTLPDGDWDRYVLSLVPDNPLGTKANLDSHNVYAISMDTAGHLHIAGDMHGDSLQYAVSNSPRNHTAWTGATMVGDETAITYPKFVRLLDGTLLFFARQVDTTAKIIVNVYDPDTQTWARRSTIAADASNTPYLDHVAVDRSTGHLHVTYSWRTGGDATTNEDLFYARSEDGGETWVAMDGTALTTPLARSAGDPVVDFASGAGFINQCGLEVDMQGRPHGAYWFQSGGVNVLHHIWWDGDSWQDDVVHTFDSATDLATSTNVSAEYGRPAVVTTGAGRAYILLRVNRPGWRGSVWAIDVTPGDNHDYATFPILDIDLQDWEPNFDGDRLYSHDQLVMPIVPCSKHASLTEEETEYGTSQNWEWQWGGVLTVDLDRIGSVQKGAVRLPTIRQVASTGARALDVTATTATQVAVPDLFVTGQDRPALLFARLRVRGSCTDADTTMHVAVREINDTDSTTKDDVGRCTIVGTTTVSAWTPWVRLTSLPDGADIGRLQVVAWKAGTGEGDIDTVTLELGHLTR